MSQYEHNMYNVFRYFVSGRRIVDIAFFLKSIQRIKHKGFDCVFSENMVLVNEKRNGFISNFFFKCSICGIIDNIYSEDPDKKALNINMSITAATINTGQGYSQLEEFMAVLDMPCYANSSYQKYHEKVYNHLFDATLDEIKLAGMEEAKLAIENGEMDDQKRALVTVVADGAWSKRSYKTNYNASSGVASIIGYRTKKCLFMSVRNKYCVICDRASSTNNILREHKCYKNWNGTSTSMESDIIVEGFKESISMHNIVYNKLIGDGDSSVSKKLQLAKPYGPDVIIQKIECRNHILRNYINRLRDIAGRRKSSSGKIVPGDQRNLLRSNLQKLRCAVTKAIEYRKEMIGSHNEKVNLLKYDIMNGPYHVFGNHENCATYFCNKKDDTNNINHVPGMEKSGLWSDILSARNLLAHHTSSLIYNVNNNSVEGYNSVVAKYVGGKRINFSYKGSYQARCTAAVLSYNAGPKSIGILHKKMTDISPGDFTKRFISKKQTLKVGNRKRRLIFKPRKHSTKVILPDNDYGNFDENICEELDMDENEYEEKKMKFMKNKIIKNKDEIKLIEKSTKLQSECELWRKERRIRLTASNFGKICKLRPTTSRANTIKSILYDTFCGNEHTKYGIEFEPFAKAEFKKLTGFKIQEAGLFIDENLHYLAASPDGLLDDNGIIEIKCPSTIKDLTPREAIQMGKLKFATLDNKNNLQLKQNDKYYFQVMGQLKITQRSFCYFIIWSPKGN